MIHHVNALFTHDVRLRLLRVNEPGGGPPAPRFYLGRTRLGHVCRFRADLPESLIAELTGLYEVEPIGVTPERMPRYVDAYLRLLETHEPVNKVSAGPAYYFAQYLKPARPLITIKAHDAQSLQNGFVDLIDELPTWQPFLGLVEQGRVVSVCRSVRITPQAHEAGVETLPDRRGKGYATDVVAGWARAVQSIGSIPLYSTSWENHASQAVARKLGLVQFGVDFHVR